MRGRCNDAIAPCSRMAPNFVPLSSFHVVETGKRRRRKKNKESESAPLSLSLSIIKSL